MLWLLDTKPCLCQKLFLLPILPQPLLPEILFWGKEDEGFRLDFSHQYIPQLDILALWPLTLPSDTLTLWMSPPVMILFNGGPE